MNNFSANVRYKEGCWHLTVEINGAIVARELHSVKEKLWLRSIALMYENYAVNEGDYDL